MSDVLEGLVYDARGLIPAVVQDAETREVLMLAYMSRESLGKTLETGRTWFFSRSRGKLWQKGETSGNSQSVLRVFADCDHDALLVEVKQTGPACHTGRHTCFHNPVLKSGEEGEDEALATLLELAELIHQRRLQPEEGSYTSDLLRSGPNAILRKIAEESFELVLASRDGQQSSITWEAADLLYHMMVLLESHGLNIRDVASELKRRRRR